eukprot:Pompholyxophrys_punicea_v1_NODE_1005_length_1048_cov_5.557905.p2 type:complete len:111 gc:universal NODE_1005_length_1048_cov_5.557905:485-817(+)
MFITDPIRLGRIDLLLHDQPCNDSLLALSFRYVDGVVSRTTKKVYLRIKRGTNFMDAADGLDNFRNSIGLFSRMKMLNLIFNLSNEVFKSKVSSDIITRPTSNITKPIPK